MMKEQERTGAISMIQLGVVLLIGMILFLVFGMIIIGIIFGSFSWLFILFGIVRYKNYKRYERNKD